MHQEAFCVKDLNLTCILHLVVRRVQDDFLNIFKNTTNGFFFIIVYDDTWEIEEFQSICKKQ